MPRSIAAPLRQLALALGTTFALVLFVDHMAAQQPAPPASAEQEAAAEAVPLIPQNSLISIVSDGGILMAPILFCSFLLLLFTFERAISLRRGRIIPGPFVKRFLQELRDGNLDQIKALELCEQNDSPVARVFAAAVQKWRRPAVEVEQAIIDSGERVANGLRKYLRLFNGISTITPLLGLLGTVVGMIQAFNDVATADAMGRHELLAGGISLALITTAAGLTVAIPALCIYLYFLSRVDKLVIDLDELGQHVVSEIASDVTKIVPKKKTSRRRAA